MSTANGKVKELTDANFENETAKGITFIDFWAEWCFPCRMQGPIFEKAAKTLGERASFAKLNVDEARDTAIRFGVQGIPTTLVIKDGREVKRMVGLTDEETFKQVLDQLAPVN